MNYSTVSKQNPDQNMKQTGLGPCKLNFSFRHLFRMLTRSLRGHCVQRALPQHLPRSFRDLVFTKVSGPHLPQGLPHPFRRLPHSMLGNAHIWCLPPILPPSLRNLPPATLSLFPTHRIALTNSQTTDIPRTSCGGWCLANKRTCFRAASAHLPRTFRGIFHVLSPHRNS